MHISETISQAFRSVRANSLRAVLTTLIIAFGIMALVGILTSIDALLFTMNDNFSRMGANTFEIRPAGTSLQSRRDGRQAKRGDPIDYRQAIEFKERFSYPGAVISISAFATGGATLKYGNEKTNPTVRIRGIDQAFLELNGFDLELGRNFTNVEQESGTQVALIGMDIVKTLFGGKPAAAINKNITIDNRRFTVVGVLASKGASINQSADRQALIPLLCERQWYGYAEKNYLVSVGTETAAQMDDAISEATGVMRTIRQLRASEENDFETQKSDGLMNVLVESTSTIRIATIIIGLVTLIGAAIGLMNIMLVSVTERTREIGITKALGATRANIMNQFLAEAVLICQVGGILGVLLGIAIGNGVALLLGGKFIIPWAWMILGLITCLIVGLASGLYPALKAARLDPIESLRYE